ncbi:MAG TPA: NUDIX domain-containing protein [Ramlibacter sp.]|uniref:NUDIX domain-containing protein n=1 Tax=Ramlibacter sp. TaxID=1917967 RepID=UPI002B711457|nr:NUDIX domain-containing protein [Ramlibacter sp.]HVZ43335.1 NUDIX domain-containing protein [Ramlibacter sp.]
MSGLGDPWLASLRERTDCSPLAPREPLWWGHHRIGSVEHHVAAALHLPQLKHERDGWRIHGDMTPSLEQIAEALRDAGTVRAWRNEQLAVIDDEGHLLGTCERGVARLLGIATRAVHLIGLTPEGHHWVQQRALDKASDPGMWDTLVGGMVAAKDTRESALERETWEEAGLRMAELQEVAYGGHLFTRRPSGEQPCGYVVERIDWYRAVVPRGVVPTNQDGEVAQFASVAPAQLCTRLQHDEFTLDAGLIFVAAGVGRERANG